MNATYDKNDLKSVLEAIRDELGKEIFRDAGRMYGLICDFAPELSAEGGILRQLSEKKLLSELETAADSQNQTEIARVLMKIRYQLTKQMFISEEKADFFLNALETLYGLKTPPQSAPLKPMPPQPTIILPTPQPTPTPKPASSPQPVPPPPPPPKKLNLLVILFVCIVVFGILLSTIREGYTGDVTWKLNYFTGVLVISGNGRMDDYDYMNHRSPWKDSKRVTSIIIEEGVTYIGAASFSYCENMTNVTVPSSVTGIGRNAFTGCDNLSKIKIPDGVTIIQPKTFAFSGLQNVIIPENVQVIGEEAFWFCPLENAVIPNSVVRINSKAFAATDLKSVSIPANAKVADNAFDESCKQKSSPKKKKFNTNFYCSEKGVTKRAGEDCLASRNKIIGDIYV